ncbi:glycerate kinase family protein [Aestuariimicrobium ganziense]|uniref:glycerate kinase family protein n=1 Tax=Aestuariimicrobium ganziense TaxID=2773677 RepID=UPI001F1C69B7|nr:glycerate kinase [Aestuariimicrobium ganziense]
MRVVVAIDKFKGSLTAAEAARAVVEGVRQAWPEARVDVVPVGDGGDGTLEAAVLAGFEYVPVTCSGPLGEPVASGYAVRDQVAVVELADACGLLRLPQGGDGRPALDGWNAGTAGLGQVMTAAIESGCHTVVVGLGGSASTDGGAGMLQALGVALLDGEGQPIVPGVAGLQTVEQVGESSLVSKGVSLVAATDVDSPLLGPRGAAAIFGPQKGLDEAGVRQADAALARLADLVETALGRSERDIPGAGAAGGTGWALLVLGAQVRRGIDVVLEWSNADDLLAGADLVITGEGSLDEQSLGGKTPVGVAQWAARHGVPCVAVSGRRTITDELARAAGFEDAVALTEVEPDLQRCQDEAARLLVEATRRLVERQIEVHEGAAAAGFGDEVWPVYSEVFGDHDRGRFTDELWGRHSARPGFRLALSRRGGKVVGFAWGYTGERGQWWSDQVATHLPEVADEWLGGHFEFVELGVLESARGERLGARLHDALLSGLPHGSYLLGTDPDPDDPGHRLYARRGWQVLGRLPWNSVVMGRRA